MASAEGAAPAPPKPPLPEGNPAFKMAGLPSRFKLPSRNWLIFLSLVGTFSGAIYYDKRERKRIQDQWCARVSSLAQKPLPTTQLPRRITVVLGSFPGDGLVHTREFFYEYVRPILHAAALDWDVIEGAREGDIRAGVAEKIRQHRRRRGEGSAAEADNIPELQLLKLQADGEELTEKEKARLHQFVIDEFRERNGIPTEAGLKGDLVIGRHAWKEYVRGLHEGWLGSADTPARPEPVLPPKPENTEDEKAVSKAAEAEKLAKQKARRMPLPSSISTDEYDSAPLPPSIPPVLDPVTTVPFPHVMGFLNTPTRFYRFLTRRYLADEVGRQVAALVLEQNVRPFGQNPSLGRESEPTDVFASAEPLTPAAEISAVLKEEEKCWHKSVWKRVKEAAETKAKKDESASGGGDVTKEDSSSGSAAAEEKKELVWTDEMVLDSRIVERMRRFELDSAAVSSSLSE